jgi:putative inorganic carbon (HCO3(-)) transporter
MKLGRALDALALFGLVLYAAAAGLSIAVSQIGYGLALAAWIAALVLRRAPFRRTGLEPFLIAYAAAELLSFAFSQDHAQNFVYMRRLLLIPMVWVVADRLRTPRDLAWVLVPMIAVADALSLWGIAQYLGSAGGLEHRVRLLQHVLTTSGILMLVSLLALGLLLAARSWPARLALAASVVAINLCQLFTYSRSAWLGTLAALPVLIGFWRPRALLALPVAALLAIPLLPAPMRDRLASAFDPSHPRNVERVNMWRAGVKMVREHPWTGVGDIGLGKLYPRYAPPGTHEMVSHLHDNVIMLAVTLGIPGLLAVVALFARMVVLLLANARALRAGPARGVAVGALAGVVAFLVMGLFEWNLGDAEAAMMLWCVVGLSCAAARGGAGEAPTAAP